MIRIINCKGCGRKIEANHGRRKYCKVCKIKARRESKARYDKKYRKTENYRNNLKRYYINLEHRGINRLERSKLWREKRKEHFQSEEGKEDYAEFLKRNNKRNNTPKRKIKREEYRISAKGRDTQVKSRNKSVSLKHKFTRKQWKDKLEKTKGICPHCKKMIGIDNLTMDHILPISKAPNGYVYKINDIQPLCKSCNIIKSNTIDKI